MQTPHILSPADVEHWCQAPGSQVIDCRSAAEFAAGHIPGSRHLPLDELPARVADIDPARPVVFVCASGRRAAQAAQLLAGARAVAILDGGLKSWTAAGRPVVRTAPSSWTIERQVRLVVGVLVSGGSALAFFDPRWALVPMAVAGGLTVAALTDSCALGALLQRMPWNRHAAPALPAGGAACR